MQIKILFTTLLIIMSLGSTAQKLKYKDIYPYLKSKNYEKGIPQLKQYLAVGENSEEASPNLEMGIWLHERLKNIDDEAQLTEVGDSAVYFLKKAKNLIDEKEVKKREEYYLEFKRRDLRTGKFGVKVSDVHLDIENRIDDIRKRQEKG
ncbi:hypothetical protein [Ekhidna sp.]|uniref:hypothetical protein n=1 Tax=Ekhidna sp. TaxID=2608089 RepID=UPI003CCBF194